MLLNGEKDLAQRSLGSAMVVAQQQPPPPVEFQSLGLSSNICHALEQSGYRVPTRCHRRFIPHFLSGRDIMTNPMEGEEPVVAILAPMLEKLKQHMPQGGSRALILYPTDDLARRTFEFAEKLAALFTDITIGLLVGGDSMKSHLEKLSLNPDVIIATPDSLLQHLGSMSLSLRTVEYVVFDEASRLLRMGFGKKLHQIVGHLNENRQTSLLVDAFTREALHFGKAVLRLFVHLRPISEIRDERAQKLALGLSSLTLTNTSKNFQGSSSSSGQSKSKDVMKRNRAVQQQSSNPSQEPQQRSKKYVKSNKSGRVRATGKKVFNDIERVGDQTKNNAADRPAGSNPRKKLLKDLAEHKFPVT